MMVGLHIEGISITVLLKERIRNEKDYLLNYLGIN